MKRPALSDRDRRTVTIAGVIVLLVVGYFKGVAPYNTAYQNTSARLTSTRDSLAKELVQVRMAQTNPQRQHNLDSAMDAMGRRLFVGKDSVAATDDLEQYIRLLAHEARVHVPSTKTEGTTTLPTGVRTLRLGFTAQSDLQGIVAFLDSLEHGDHLVCIEKMQLTVMSSVDTSKGVQAIQMVATADGYQVPPAVQTVTGRAGSPPPAFASAASAGSPSTASAAAGRSGATASIACDPAPPTFVPSTPATLKRTGQ